MVFILIEKRKYKDKYDDSYRINGGSASGSNASEGTYFF